MTDSPIVIALTGGIASGKSSIARMFSDLGVTIIDSDRIARELFKPDSIHLAKLKTEFGNHIFFENGELNRKALGKIVFSNPDKLNWLNNFTHPLVFQEINKQLENAKSNYVIVDIPLLIKLDGKISKQFKSIIDRILVVSTPEKVQIERLIKRDKISTERALDILNTQSTLKQKLALADDVINNSSTLSELRQQVVKLNDKYCKLGANS